MSHVQRCDDFRTKVIGLLTNSNSGFSWFWEYLRQANDGSLKTAHFPKEYGSFRMKVSFGQGTPTKVPWVSFLEQGMSTSNGYFPVFLFYKEDSKLVLSFGISETNEFGATWKSSILKDAPKVSEVIPSPPRYGESWVFRAYDVDYSDNVVSISDGRGNLNEQQVESDLQEILSLYRQNLDVSLGDVESPRSAGLFYMEKQLEDFIIENWESSELGRKFDLIVEDGVMVSQQYRTAIGPIDILARDKLTGSYVVIELKRNQTSDDTVGQVSRYMGWIKEHFGDEDVRGIIISGKYDERLYYAQTIVPNVEVYIYAVSFSLSEHKRQ